MQSLNVNRINRLNFLDGFRNSNIDKIERLKIQREEIFSVKSRLKGSYQYTKDCLADLFVSGEMDRKTFLRRMEEISKQYTKMFQQNGINI